MTATGAKRSMGTQGTRPSRPRLSLFSLRSRRRKEGAIRARLRIKSSPGAFLALGAFVVIVGAMVAAVGYWPYQAHQAGILGPGSAGGGLGDSQVAGWSLGAMVGPPHSERMKLLGPVLMGVGLFILICANSVLYENRDRETQQLVSRARAVICTVSASVPPEAPPYGHALTKHYQWMATLPAPNLGLCHLGPLVGSEPVLWQAQFREFKWADIGHSPAAPLTNHEPHGESPSPPVSLCSAHSDSPISSHASPPALTAVSLTVPGVAPEPGSQERDGWDIRAPPRRCYSLSSRTVPRQDGTLGKESGSHVCLNMMDPQSWSTDLDRASRHCSWPWLDLNSTRSCLKLESKEEVDTVLNLVEQE
ncbi:transmembrane protein 200B-like [Megalops cyprinoides]|uniref:transmembrane protein 200B-like n=1 Tax=Megalops cyprinoides TaxID=118141 RepID=UPI0018648199|nr:transmembrane protein 200B-like [Megalops cyprinoides]XP_036372135.1 transmembrane protein 200B-like [Megalops cyprinoides]